MALEQLGAGLGANERAGVFLTNALTGWEPHTTKPLPFPELEQERKDATEVKQQRPILVVLGNPPYNGFPGVSEVDEERKLTDAYRTVKQVPGADLPTPKGQGLNDLYVRFYRMAERRIAEKTGQGIVCFISNYSWLDGLSFPGMRQRYLDAFDIVRIDNLNGDKYRTGKLTPDGDSDPSIFSTSDDPVGIQVGTAIATLVRKESHQSAEQIDWRELWGKGKLQELDESTESGLSAQYQKLEPMAGLGLPFAPVAVSDDWFDWPSLVDLFPTSFPGVKTSRDKFVIDTELSLLRERMETYFDGELSHDAISARYPSGMKSTKRYNARKVRGSLVQRGGPIEAGYVQTAFRPFDDRWMYWEAETKLLDEKRADYVPHVFHGNISLCANKNEIQDDFTHGLVTGHISNWKLGYWGMHCFPLYLRDDQFGEEVDGVKRTANLSELAQTYIQSMSAEPEDLFHHVLATLHDPAYREANAGGLRMGWPRIPLPDSADALAQSAATGRRLARLLDTESDVTDLLDTSIAVPTTIDGAPMQPNDFKLTAGWGHFGANKAVMPGQGKVKRRGEMVDVYLNNRAYWKDVPSEVWEYR